MVEKKSGKKKKKKVRLSIKAKEPSAKTVFKEKVTELEGELEHISGELEEEEKLVEDLKRQHEDEITSKEACVEYLKRVLQGVNEDLILAQERLEFVRDLKELTQQRAENLSRNLQRNCQVKRSIFLQQQAELEEKLSRLEDLRQKRSTQLNRLKQVEGDLEAQISTNRKEHRKENKTHVNELLQKREHFISLVNSYCSDSREVFEVSLPVYAKYQVKENIRQRTRCYEASEDLLALQDKGRDLKKAYKTLNIELGTQKSAETRLKILEDHLEDKHQCLLEEGAHLQKKYGNSQADIKTILSEIRKVGRKIARIENKLVNAKNILRDQGKYQKSLEKLLEKKLDMNGLMASKILRAAQMFKAKVTEVENKKSSLDFDLLKQMHMLLEDDN
ncbi:uncharacterized protein NPIL_316301 [Nephila pilipes]|uniref:Uncharacterized protein n=1 Tax=Nephila pilipes TaxID=299642 RepID=A0A8X6NFH5_NEPPI|nr:uncharacterized protein NPIL_316301 [Nephila pilipes]